MSHDGFIAAEKHQSQVPALQLLVALGFTPLSQEGALRLRGGRLRNVVLDDVLAEQLMRINRYTHRGREYGFDLEDAHEAIRRLKPTPDRLKGLRGTNQDIYDTLVLGTTITKSIDGDSKSYSFRYIDWEQPDNNVFHVTAEFSVERTASSQTKRCDIVAFVNGIPILVVENKRPTESLKKADSQLIGYQNEDNIPQLFHFAQLLIGMNRNEARYATVGTPRKFWQTWRDEEDTDEAITPFANHVLTAPEKDAIFSGDFVGARAYFDAMAAEGERAITVQDRTVYALCRPERLLDLIRRFTVFDGGVRKVARHQQFFGIRRAVETVKQHDVSGARKGGVIWHTQGSGKSLTMVMLGRSLALERSIGNPRIIIVTDRDDLDKQIKETFKSCDLEPVRATSGAHLLELVQNKAPLVTTIINKFDTALKNSKLSDDDPDIFVLVDETVHDVREEIRKLPQLHDQLWDLFKPVRNKKDMEQFEQHLADEALRHEFYSRLKAFSRCLHISLSSDKLFDVFDEAKVDTLKRDWKQFSELKRSVQLRYQETVDVREFEPKIQKLLDNHVVAMPAETIIEVVNINDPEALKAVVEEAGVSQASRADRIASATRRAITEKMDEDPAFYKQFSELLEETIRAYREKRLSEREYLNSVMDLASKVARKDRGRDVPESIRGDEDAQAFFGVLDGQLKTTKDEPVSCAEAASITLEIIDIIKSQLIVDIWSNEVAQNNLRNAIDDYFFDVLRDEQGIDLPMEVLDDLELKIMDLARARFAA
ncbi:Type-1 restriction enzyme R protein [Roseovarius tolerans]|uniref:type I site-specific deoxyribonuclease n=1 Tax=Roseovarius tolerans TaxID=74031 RepID=A0A0L6CWD0_9RHOB|nr:type I restriction endonuclease [Roseovarius tolerans]KNX42074.1 Type-1 restriction enzyme R protein [Roseovarius tolerans]